MIQITGQPVEIYGPEVASVDSIPMYSLNSIHYAVELIGEAICFAGKPKSSSFSGWVALCFLVSSVIGGVHLSVWPFNAIVDGIHEWAGQIGVQIGSFQSVKPDEKRVRRFGALSSWKWFQSKFSTISGNTIPPLAAVKCDERFDLSSPNLENFELNFFKLKMFEFKIFWTTKIIHFICIIPAANGWLLSRACWQMISNSKRLALTENESPCHT